MSDETYSFSTARARLEEIVTQVRKKDTSLEKSLDLLEEGVRLANTCTELIDHADWTAGEAGEPVEGVERSDEPTGTAQDEVSTQAVNVSVEVAEPAPEDSPESPDDAPEYRDDEA